MISIFIIHKKMQILLGLAVVSGFFLLFGCSTRVAVAPPPSSLNAPIPPKISPKPYRVGNNWYQPLAQIGEYKEKGLASWYGDDFHGKKTSSGEIYNMYDMTAAHKILPLGTHVRVKNLSNSRTIEVRINDRGPFVRGRIIDLSYTAAKKLEMIGPGTAPVEIIALGKTESLKNNGTETNYMPVDYFSGNFSVQVGAFQDLNNAEKLRKNLEAEYDNAHIITHNNGKDTFYRVRVGRYSTVNEVMAIEELLVENGFAGAFSVAD